jgi:hypothetical protein
MTTPFAPLRACHPAEKAMPAKRPASFTVFAVLCIVFVSGGLACNACGLAGQVALPMLKGMAPKPGPGEPDIDVLQRELEAKVPNYQAVQWGSMAISIVMSTLLLVTGIGLLKMQAWSRWTCILYGVSNILLQIALMVYNIAFVIPVTTEFMNEKMKAQNVSLPPGLTTALTVIVSLIVMAFAVILLIFAGRPRMGEQLASIDAKQEPAAADYYDEDYERRRREPPADI